MGKKVCTKCGNEKEIELFGIHKQASDGRMSECKDCHNKRHVEYSKTDYEAKKLKNCENTKRSYWKNLDKNRKASRDYRNAHRDKMIEQDRAYKKAHKEEMAIYNKEYYSRPEVKERINKQRRERRIENKDEFNRKRREANAKIAPLIKKKRNRKVTEKNKLSLQKRLAHNYRTRIATAISERSQGGRFKELIGCDFIFFKAYMESLFGDRMSWDNYGFGVDKWTIDHIKPIKMFDMTDKEQIKEAFNYKNCKPMWFSENASKGAWYDGVDYRKNPS